MEKIINDIKQLLIELETLLSSKQFELLKLLTLINDVDLNLSLSTYLITKNKNGFRISIKLISIKNIHCPISIYFGQIYSNQKSVEMYNILFGNSWQEDIEIKNDEAAEDKVYFLNFLSAEVTEKKIYQKNKLCRIEYEHLIDYNVKVTSQDRLYFVWPFLKKNVVTNHYKPWID
ncbi:MAG TPA: hypothetical protein PLE30_11225 [Candidatus Kapabacteria bacterium]|nr:hypothetical protein [Candidatus Kapabacteria bacterium]